jgi:hypothetical protein
MIKETTTIILYISARRSPPATSSNFDPDRISFIAYHDCLSTMHLVPKTISLVQILDSTMIPLVELISIWLNILGPGFVDFYGSRLL